MYRYVCMYRYIYIYTHLEFGGRVSRSKSSLLGGSLDGSDTI